MSDQFVGQSKQPQQPQHPKPTIMSKKTQDWIFLIDGSYLLKVWEKVAPEGNFSFTSFMISIQDYFNFRGRQGHQFFYFDSGEEDQMKFKPKSIDSYFSQVKRSGCKIIEGVKPLDTLDSGNINFSADIVGHMASLGSNIVNYKIVVVSDDPWLIKPFIQYLHFGARIYSVFFCSNYEKWYDHCVTWATLVADGEWYHCNASMYEKNIFYKSKQLHECITGLNTPRSQINPVFADKTVRRPVDRQALLEIITSAHS